MNGTVNAGILGYTQAEVDSLLSTMVSGINASGTVEIHVAKTGNDTTGDGNLEKPVLTIVKAVELAYTYFGAEIISFRIHDGVYDEIVSLIGLPSLIKVTSHSGDIVKQLEKHETMRHQKNHSMVKFHANIV